MTTPTPPPVPQEPVRKLLLGIASAVLTAAILGLGSWVREIDQQVILNAQELENRASAIMTARANATDIALIKRDQARQGSGIGKILRKLRKSANNKREIGNSNEN